VSIALSYRLLYHNTSYFCVLVFVFVCVVFIYFYTLLLLLLLIQFSIIYLTVHRKLTLSIIRNNNERGRQSMGFLCSR
jgi:hypothetical protein